jgi:hypothetical protein
VLLNCCSIQQQDLSLLVKKINVQDFLCTCSFLDDHECSRIKHAQVLQPKVPEGSMSLRQSFAAAGPLHHYEQLKPVNVSDCDSVVQDRGAARDFKISEPAL